MIDIIQAEMDACIHNAEGIPSKETIRRETAGVDAIVCALGDPIDSEIMQTNPSIKVIHVLTSTNRPEDYYECGMDLEVANKIGICITNSPVMAEPIADFAFALMLATSRRIVEADNFVRQGEWHKTAGYSSPAAWSYTLHIGSDVFGKTIGIIGLGRIGRLVAKRAKGFDMRVLYYDTTRQTPIEDVLGIEYKEMDDLLKESDFVTLHTPEIRHIIGKHELRLMKKSSYLINTARGGNIDLAALVEALENGYIAGAGLDVYEMEPVGSESPLAKFNNVVLAHHMAPCSVETCRKLAIGAVKNIVDVMNGRKPPNLVNQPNTVR